VIGLEERERKGQVKLTVEVEFNEAMMEMGRELIKSMPKMTPWRPKKEE